MLGTEAVICSVQSLSYARCSGCHMLGAEAVICSVHMLPYARYRGCHIPRSKYFVRVFVNIMSFCYFGRKLLCRILMCGHISYLLLGETSPMFV
jgi:hypothetical protein